jgi:hypothetical protein
MDTSTAVMVVAAVATLVLVYWKSPPSVFSFRFWRAGSAKSFGESFKFN